MDKNIQIEVYYDINCAFCLKSLKFTQKNITTNLSLKSLEHFPFEVAKKTGIDISNKYEYMIVKNVADSKLYFGYYGFLFIYSNYAKSIIFRKLLTILSKSVLFNKIGVWVYSLVAKNRRLFGCDSDACSIHGKI